MSRYSAVVVAIGCVAGARSRPGRCTDPVPGRTRGDDRGHDFGGHQRGRRPFAGREHACARSVGPHLGDARRRGSRNGPHRSRGGCAPAGMVAGRRPHRLPGVLGRQLPHLERGRGRDGVAPAHARPVRPPRAALVAGRRPPRVFVGPGRELRRVGDATGRRGTRAADGLARQRIRARVFSGWRGGRLRGGWRPGRDLADRERGTGAHGRRRGAAKGRGGGWGRVECAFVEHGRWDAFLQLHRGRAVAPARGGGGRGRAAHPDRPGGGCLSVPGILDVGRGPVPYGGRAGAVAAGRRQRSAGRCVFRDGGSRPGRLCAAAARSEGARPVPGARHRLAGGLARRDAGGVFGAGRPLAAHHRRGSGAPHRRSLDRGRSRLVARWRPPGVRLRPRRVARPLRA